MKQNFLDKVAEYIIDRFPQETGEVCIVLPNRRAGLFLKQYLSQRIEKPIFSPPVFSVDDFVFHLSGFEAIEPVYLLFEFYKIYTESERDKADSFTEFINWAEVVLQDFNEVDLYLVDPEALYNYLTDSKALSIWNLNDQPLTEFEAKYLHFFQNLHNLYSKLSKSLVEKKQVYPGLAYKSLLENLKKDQVNIKWKKVIFAGFNALTFAEERIIKKLKQQGIADILWDADNYYLENKIQEAGHFLRRNKHEFKLNNLEWTNDHFTQHKSIHLIGVPGNVGQVKVAGDVLRTIARQGLNLNRTSVVLNDESLLTPLLNSLPQDIDEFNITMGLPLMQTPLYELINEFVILNENSIKFGRSKDSYIYYYKNLTGIFDHPFFASLNLTKGNEEKISEKIRNNNQVFYDENGLNSLLDEVDSHQNELIKSIFKPWENSAQKAIEGIILLLSHLKEAFATNAEPVIKGNTELNLELVFHFSKLFNRLRQMTRDYHFLDDLNAFRGIFNQIVRGIRIPFYGEPLKGVQVMGMLETRTLDFENVIMMSVNEDFLPAGKSGNSFIPFEIKRQFKLPTYKDRNAVFAYHFYRLLQRADNISLIYNTEAGDLSGGDKSRFITQLEHELIKYNPKVKIKKSVLTLPADTTKPKDTIRIEKDTGMMDKLKSIASSGFSPSALNAYRNCSLRFYFRYILGIDESDEVEETIEASTLGTVVHDVLHTLYQPYQNKTITPQIVKSFLSGTAPIVKSSFASNYTGGEIRYGKNLLISKVAETFVKSFLKAEIKWLKELEKFNSKLYVKSLEGYFRSILTVEGIGMISLKGVIDRIDVLDNTLRIIDYKTGKVDKKELSLKSWDELLEQGLHDKTFQLLFYEHLYQSARTDERFKTQTGIISFRNLSGGLITPVLPEINNGDSHHNLFEEILSDIFCEMFNIQTPFKQTENKDCCQYCIYKSVCNA